MWNLLIGPISNIIGDVLRRVLPPEKMSEADRSRLEQELRLRIMEHDFSEFEAEIQDRADARALAQAELARGNALTNVLAALHRPAWSFVMLGLFVLSVLDKMLGLPDVVIEPEAASIMKTVVIFYFGGRSVEHAVSLATTGQRAGSAAPKLVKPANPGSRPKPDYNAHKEGPERVR